MTFVSPEWFLLIPAGLVAAWLWPRCRTRSPVRAVLLALLVVALAHPLLRRARPGLDLFVLVDRSASAAEALARSLPEWEGLIQKAKKPEDQLAFIDYGAAAQLRGTTGSGEVDPEESRTALAVRFALSQTRKDRLSRFLVLSDGYSTEPLQTALEPLLAAGHPLDYRFLTPKTGVDFQVNALDAPQRVQPGESFLIEAVVSGSRDETVAYELLRDQQKIGGGSVAVVRGQGRIRFADRLREPGAHRYEVRLQPGEDAYPENNRAESWVEMSGGARVLVVSPYAQDPVAGVLAAQGFDVRRVQDPAELHLGLLSGTRLVVLNNVAAARVPEEFLRGLDFFVRGQGGGLLMLGGASAFGSGGYFQTAVDELLPVSMELRKDQRKLSMAMAIVMDRSGSMAAGVAQGARQITKMDLANEGAARAVGLLGDRDWVSVFAVDSAAHRVVRHSEVGPNRREIVDRVRRVASAGGGIFVYEGLKAGWEELKKAEVGQRHLILFADAADAEEPGDYKTLLEEMVREGASVSVIGMGTRSDSDAAFLEDVAARGNGRAIFNANPEELPALFAQETVTVARSAFLKEPVALKGVPGWHEIAGAPLQWPAQVDAYNVNFLRPGATAAALSADEDASPLVAFWQKGAGRTAAVTFPLAGEYSESVRAWPGYPELVATLSRWLSGEGVPPGLGLAPRLSGTELEVDLFYDEQWTERIAAHAPKLLLAAARPGEPREVPWDRLAPGHFRARWALAPGEKIRGAVQIGKTTLPFGPVQAGKGVEWQFRREAPAELRALSAASGGRERLDLATSWDAPTVQRQFADLRSWVLAAVLVGIVADALLTRVGFSWGSRRKTPGAQAGAGEG